MIHDTQIMIIRCSDELHTCSLSLSENYLICQQQHSWPRLLLLDIYLRSKATNKRIVDNIQTSRPAVDIICAAQLQYLQYIEHSPLSPLSVAAIAWKLQWSCLAAGAWCLMHFALSRYLDISISMYLHSLVSGALCTISHGTMCWCWAAGERRSTLYGQLHSAL